VEKERAGGTCLNWGCIPTKSLLRNAELFHLMKHPADEFGLTFDNLRYDWSKIIQRSRDVADKNDRSTVLDDFTTFAPRSHRNPPHNYDVSSARTRHFLRLHCGT
jgi:hypothetical protein